MLKNEYELKYRLEARDYDCLVESMKNYPSEKVVQKNYYYDTYNQDLRKNNITMRVREKNGKAYGTIKRHLGNHTSTEEYFAVTLPRQILLYEGQDVYQAGMMQTERTTFRLTESVLLTLDHNTFLGICDYELEIECPRNLLLPVDRLMTVVLSFKPQEHSKSERFFRRWNELRNEPTLEV